MVPAGNTPMRYGLYQAIKEINATGRRDPQAIRAIIVLSDGDYNFYGDPLARGIPYPSSTNGNANHFILRSLDFVTFDDLTSDQQNLSLYAINNSIRIYSIGYAGELSQAGKTTLRILAESTGGEYYDGNAANIDGIYTLIADKLKEEAGVGTVLDLSYDKIEVNAVITPVNASYQVFNYMPNTTINSVYSNQATVPGYPKSIDQSNEYTQTPQKLTFNIGTVKLGQVWEAKYQLKVLTNGTINTFGDGSKVMFNGTNGLSQITVPKTYITSIGEMAVTEIGTPNLTISVVEVMSDSDEPQIARWRLIHTYNGTGPVQEDIYLSTDGRKTWTLMRSGTLDRVLANAVGEFQINWYEYPPGTEVEIKVIENAADAPQATATSYPPSRRPDALLKNYIKLK
jgi:hypothetical protein